MTIPTENADFLVGDDNFNFINGLGGNDLIFGMGADDLLLGGEGNDILAGGRGDDTLNGGNGIDTANYNDAVFGINANLSTGKVTLTANWIAEVDTLLGIENITGGGGSDTITGNAAVNRLNGMAGSDFITGGGGADKIDGGDGFDTMSYAGTASGVNVSLVTGIGSGGDAEGDTLVNVEAVKGWNFDDKLRGNDQGNFLDGGAGKDTIIGGGGDDSLAGGLGADVIKGGTGSDTIYYHDTSVQIDLLNHTATGGEAEGDVISEVESISGSFFNDILLGDAAGNELAGGNGEDILTGRSGNDALWGQIGSDIMSGGDGTDLLVGGAGQDVMTGGKLQDTFRFDQISETGAVIQTSDLITDFISGEDKINLSAIDANTLLSGNQNFTFIETNGFSGKAGELKAVFVGGNTLLQGDVNGDHTVDFVIELTGHITFAVGDFIL